MTQVLFTDNLKDAISVLEKRVENLILSQSSSPRQRMLVALAGVPGSGKSTVTSALLVALAARGIENVAVVPQDGFHYTKKILASLDNPDEAFRRRGAPFTFDADGFRRLVLELKESPVTMEAEPEAFIHAPSFDHAIQDPIDNGYAVSSKTKIVIVEGNYTLMNQKPWSEVARFSDERWFIDTPRSTAKERLIHRHIAAGIEQCQEAAAFRTEENDLPNGDLVRASLIEPNVVIKN